MPELMRSSRSRWKRLFEQPKVWTWGAVLGAFLSCGFLQWLYQSQRDELVEAVTLAETVRSVRLDLAKGGLRIHSSLPEPERALQHAAGLALVEQAIAQLAGVLRTEPVSLSVNPGYELSEAELTRRGDEYIGLLRRQMRDELPDDTALNEAYGALERFSESVDRAHRERLSVIRQRARRDFTIALLGTEALLIVICVGVLLAFREESRSRERSRRATKALSENEDLLHAMGDNLPQSYVFQYAYDGDGKPHFLYLSAGAERIHRRSIEAIKNDPRVLHEQIDPERREELLEAERRSLETMSDFDMELKITPPNGRPRWLHFRSRPRRRSDGQVVWDGVATDITATQKANEELLAHKLMLEQTGHIAKVGGWTLDIASGAGAWTEELAHIHDLDPGSTIDLNQGLSFYTEESRPRIGQAVQRAIDFGESYDLELEIVSARGVRKWVRTIGHAVKENGQVVRLHGSLQDISERKQLEEQFLRAQRLEAIGTLAGGVAHDLNNILAPIMMITALLRTRLEDEEDLEALDSLETSAQRGAGIIRQLLTFSRGAGGEKVSVQLQHLLKEMTALMRETFPREIAIRPTIAGNIRPVLGDPTQLHQVLMNLCVNARDAMHEGGELSLTAENVELNAEEARQYPHARPGPYVLITVSDNGQGISREDMNRIFDPFFTTKEPGKGTGLGLSTVLGIVDAHDGFMTVDSEPGGGSSFRVYLPATARQPPAPAADPGTPPPQGAAETILVVDDEDGIRKHTRQLLEKYNYRVLEAADGQQALEVFGEHRDSIRLVLTDMMMPVMGGLPLIRSLRGSGPKVPVIATTGLSLEAHREKLAALDVDAILVKPCSPGELLRRIRGLLDTHAERD